MVLKELALKCVKLGCVWKAFLTGSWKVGPPCLPHTIHEAAGAVRAWRGWRAPQGTKHTWALHLLSKM